MPSCPTPSKGMYVGLLLLIGGCSQPPAYHPGPAADAGTERIEGGIDAPPVDGTARPALDTTPMSSPPDTATDSSAQLVDMAPLIDSGAPDAGGAERPPADASSTSDVPGAPDIRPD